MIRGLYSALFVGDRGFLVTFVQVDPLFTLDLSDPANPKVAGELKVPGYSTYLHPLNENYLLSVGQDTIVDGDHLTDDYDFELLGRMNLYTYDASGATHYYPSWYRGVFIDDYFYGLTSHAVKAAPVDDIKGPFFTLELME